MKNLPYFRGGTCEKQKNHISFSNELKGLQFNNFEEFCNKAEIILNIYIKNKNKINIHEYKNYIYSKKLSNNPKLDIAMKDKCFEWIMSYEYDEIRINDLYSLLGKGKKGKI